ncbi:MAG: ABC transporter ATP-binding protein [Pyrinomonadaceae bacterium]
MRPIITVENLSKCYQLGRREASYLTLREALSGAARAPFNLLRRRNSRPASREHWALKDVSFEVGHGDVVGIIGRNGAGKSTLLKILSRITEPSRGRVRLYGRVGSLLEVGTGFHPELSGRDNIYLNGAILGMSRVEIARQFDEIVAFAEVEPFIDTPVKRYSSGMYLRLAFAVAAHLNPEILIIDEVLAVGDMQFQKKCLGKMSEVSQQGRTVLFVSHNMDAVRKLCNRAILLDGGEINAAGETSLVLKKYIETGLATASTYTIPPPLDEGAPAYAYQLEVEDGAGRPGVAIPVGRPWQVRVHFKVEQRTEHFIIALGLTTNAGVPVKTSWSEPRMIEPGVYQVVFREQTIWLEPGLYRLVVGLSAYERTFHYTEDAGTLEIAGFSEGVELVRVSNTGVVLNPFQIEIQQVFLQS